MSDRAEDLADLQRRLVELEVRAAFQERTIDDLDQVVRQFAARVESLERALARVEAAQAAPEPLPGTEALLAGLPDDEDL